MININREMKFISTTKSSRGLHNGASKKRSQYIGVLRNGNNWQIQINLSSKKKHFGIFSNEIEAAIMQNFFSIGVNGIDVKTNFNYDTITAQGMIMNYLTNDNFSSPSDFLTKV
ncbi:unnamed protein product [Moneuplotes crassus]|uniref:Uncharacterized protein n=1 Tax=Euplotes crassus TaxID=5936 RepID=A0AAD1XXN5_EUPCR|nr:unnamed protein product [Moneuplotes crassus]